MAKIGGTDLALLSARLGVYRLGAGRLGFFPWDVKGASNDEPGEYIWDEVKPPTTQWELQPGCEGWACGFRPVAAFTDLPDPSDEGEEVQFTDASTPASDIKTWAWDFGDGNTSTEQNPTHTYATAGTYTVTLTVTSDKGTDSATGEHTVEVVAPLTGTITGICYQNPDVPAPDQTVELFVDGSPFDTQVSDSGDASYTFLNVPAGEITLACTAVPPLGGYAGTAGPITLAGGGSEVLDIILYSS